MKSTARNSVVALLGISGLLALPASAEIGIYGGLQAGYSTTDTNEDIIELDNDKVYGIYGGYKFTDWLGVEAGYSQLGTFDIKSLDDEDVSDENEPSIEINSFYTGISLWGKFYGPLNVYAKLGAHYSESKLDKSNEDGKDFKETSYNFYYAAGLALPVADMLSITLSYQNFRNIDLLEDEGDSDLGEAGIDTVNLGVLFNF